MRRALLSTVLVILGILLSACGGGGSTPNPGGGFSASPGSLTFTALQGGALPASQIVRLTVTNPDATYVGVAFNGTAPSWLYTPTLSGAGQNWSIVLQVSSTSLPPGTYTASLKAGIAKADQTIIATQDVAITYTVTTVLGVDQGSLSYDYVPGAPAPSAQSVAVTGTGLPWQASANQAWIKLGATSGTAPSALSVNVDPAGLGVGTFTGKVTLTHPGGSDTASFDVQLNITAPALLAGATSLSFSGINGTPQTPQYLTVALNNGAAATWSASTGHAWLVLDQATGTSPATLAVTVDPSKGPLASGTYDSTIQLTCSYGGATLTKAVPVHLVLTKPTLSAAPSVVVLGGANGKDFSAQQISLNLNTGPNAFAWALAKDQAWIKPTATTGTVSASTATVSISPDTTGLQGGAHTGNLSFQATVNGDLVTTSVPVSLNLEAHLLLSSDTGVAFAAMPDLARTTRTLQIKDSYGLATTAWSAVSDQAWLTITPSGTTPSDLVLTADPTGLLPDSMHYATVTVTAPGTQNTERIQVGFWIGAAAPAALQTIPGTWKDLAIDPIRPYVYLSNGTGDITVYHIYTGAVVTTYHSGPAQFGHMTVSYDGATLYAANATDFTVVPINLGTGQLGTGWTGGGSFSLLRLEYFRCNGTGFLFTSNGAIFQASSGAVVTGLYGGVPLSFGDFTHIAASFDGRHLATADGYGAPTMMVMYDFDYSSLNGGSFSLSSPRYAMGLVFGGDMAFNQDGTRIYQGFMGTAQIYDTTTLQGIGTLPCGAPQNIEIARDGRIFAGVHGMYAPKDVYVYATDGTPIQSYKIASYSHTLTQEKMKVSGDGLRLVTITDEPVTQITTVGP